MNWTGAVVIYVMVWWVVFFAALPFGVKGHFEADEEAPDGVEPGAPVRHHLKAKALATTAIATVLWAVIVAAILLGVTPLY